jgi:FixJ family two-component response regulator
MKRWGKVGQGVRRAGNGTLRLPLDCIGPRGPHLGGPEPRARTDAVLHASSRPGGQTVNPPTLPIHLVDDDPAVLKAFSRLLTSSGFAVITYHSATDFITRRHAAPPGCLLLDMSMPGLSGLELQEWLATSGDAWPVIFISGASDIPMSVRAMKAGAVDFLTKPVDQQQLLDSIQFAIHREMDRRAREAVTNVIRERLATLTPREREVLEHVVSGQLNKQIAGDLGTVEKTIKVHRARLMRKMGAPSLADLVRMAERLGLCKEGRNSPSRVAWSVPKVQI